MAVPWSFATVSLRQTKAGVPDREQWDHQDAGDFSFIWSGIPVIFHNGYAPDLSSEILYNRLPWRHSTVLPLGAGDTPVIPHRSGQAPLNTSPDTRPMSDFYPDGLSQFMTTGLLDYAAGTVQNEYTDQLGFTDNRHFLFIKPDALVIWDQVAGQDSLEWDLWVPTVQTIAEGNVLTILSPNGIELETVFAGDTSLDYSVTPPPDSLTGDWPFFMRTALGSGSITTLTIDCTRIIESEYAPVLGQLLENIASMAGGEPVGLIDQSGTLASLFSQSSIELVVFPDDVPEQSELQQLGMVIIHLNGSALQLDRLREMNETLESFVRQGGHLVWISADRSGLFSGSAHSPGLVPVFLG
ncbi:hypothetical protein ACFL5H_03765, partial [Candidatus Latescibacterota bacterium]